MKMLVENSMGTSPWHTTCSSSRVKALPADLRFFTKRPLRLFLSSKARKRGSLGRCLSRQSFLSLSLSWIWQKLQRVTLR